MCSEYLHHELEFIRLRIGNKKDSTVWRMHVQVHGATTGVVDLTIESLRRDDETLERAERGTWATFPCPRVRVGDKVFLMETVAAD